MSMENTYSKIEQNNRYGTGKHKPTRTQLRLLACIKKAGEDGICQSKQAFADELSCSIKTIERGVAHLRALGLIEVRPSYHPTGRQSANVYRMCEKSD